MYTYQGYGIVIPISDFDETAFLSVMSDMRGEEFDTLDEFSNSEPVGTYESVDNVDFAQVNGYDVDSSNGVLIIELGGDESAVNIVMELLDYPDNWREDRTLVGDYTVECVQ